MRILHVITSLATGGAEHLLVDLLPRLKMKGHEIELCVFYGKRTSFWEELECSGIKIHFLSNKPDYYNPLNIIRLRKIMKGFDIVHTHNTAPQFFAAIGKPHGVNLYTTEHSTSNRRRNHSFFRFIDRLMYRRYKRIICISSISESSLRNYIGNNYPILTIENGIDIKKMEEAKVIDLGFDKGIYTIAMVAGFRYEKDQPSLIKALLYLPDNYHVVLVGDGEKRKDLENLISELKLEKRVHFLGLRTDVPSIIKSVDVVVMSSHREGLSLSNLEGMASGRPFVASDVDGLREITTGAGLLFKHGDSKELANIILKLASDSEYNKSIVEKCKKRAKLYDISLMVDRYNDIYK